MQKIGFEFLFIMTQGKPFFQKIMFKEVAPNPKMLC